MNMTTDEKKKLARYETLQNEAMSRLEKMPPGTNWPLSRVSSYGLFFSVAAICLTTIMCVKMILNFLLAVM